MGLKSQVEQLRNNGLGYKRIASVLGVSVNTVKSICQRNHIERNQTEEGCKFCGGALYHIKGKKKKKYCSDNCRLKWWNSHPSKVNKKAYYEYQCATCQKCFIAYGQATRKFCSHQCYIVYRFGGGYHG